MNILNECSRSGVKIAKKKINFKKLNLKKNFQIMDDPAFHLNRTLKTYINNRLNNNATEKIEISKNPNDLSKSKNSLIIIVLIELKLYQILLIKNNIFQREK